jgi:hypothetical protein
MPGFTLLSLLKFCSLALPNSDCPLNSEHPPIFTPIVCVATLDLLSSLGKPDGLVWYFGLFGFPVWSTAHRHLRNGHLLRCNLHGQNL